MERVAFLLEETGERLGCLLNPESVVLRRSAGVRPRESAGGLVAGSELADDPLLCTGGGRTELTLDLLFDVSLAGSSIATEDVRDLTGPLWELAENAHAPGAYGRPPLARFIWGKSWNVPGIVMAVAERLEYFTAGGVPRRSWLRMRMQRVIEPASTSAQTPFGPPASGLELPSGGALEAAVSGAGIAGERLEVHEISGGGPAGDGGGDTGERLDQIAHEYYGDASFWRVLAMFNDIDNPMDMPAGARLQVPPLTDLEASP